MFVVCVGVFVFVFVFVFIFVFLRVLQTDLEGALEAEGDGSEEDRVLGHRVDHHDPDRELRYDVAAEIERNLWGGDVRGIREERAGRKEDKMRVF